MWNCEITFLFISFSYYFHIFGPRTRAQAPKRRQGARHRPGPPSLWGPGPGSGPQNAKIICKWYETNIWKYGDFTISHYFHILFILFSYFYHIFGLGAQIRAPKIIFLSYCWSYYLHIIFIFWGPWSLYAPSRCRLPDCRPPGPVSSSRCRPPDYCFKDCGMDRGPSPGI